MSVYFMKNKNFSEAVKDKNWYKIGIKYFFYFKNE